MLTRIKKKQYEGFKDFVESLETTTLSSRYNIMVSGILEDPAFMQWVTKNMKTFDQLLELPSDDIEVVIRSNDSMMMMLARAMKNLDWEKYSGNFTRFLGKLRDEIGYLTEVNPAEQEKAQYFILKAVRKMQRDEKIQGFHWEMPPQDIFLPLALPREGVHQLKFIDGSLAAEGEVLKGKKIGQWKHFFETKKILAEGPYQEDLKEGLWTFFYGNGEKRSEGRYMNDSRHGEWREWSRIGEMSIAEWIEGKRQS